MLCVSHIPGGGRAVTGCPESPLSAKAPITAPRPQGRARRGTFASPTRTQPPSVPLQALLEFVNSRGRGRAPLRTSERRAEQGRGQRDSPDAAKRPEAQSSTPHSAASTREYCMLRDAGKGPRAQMLGPKSFCVRFSHTGINQALSSAHWPKGSAQDSPGRTLGGAPRPQGRGRAEVGGPVPQPLGEPRPDPVASPQPEARSRFLDGLDRGKLLRKNFKKCPHDGVLP